MDSSNERHKITIEQFDKIIIPYADRMTIQRLGVYYGSLLYFEMDKTAHEKSLGEISLTLEAYDWSIKNKNTEVCNSHLVSREFCQETLFGILQGKKINKFTITNQHTTILIESDIRIEINYQKDIIDDYKLVFSLYLPHRQSIALEAPSPELLLEIGGQKKEH